MFTLESNVTGVILAAGKSSRMNQGAAVYQDKLALPFRGLPILQHTINAARNSCLKGITVVLPPDSALEKDLDMTDCHVVYSYNRDSGQAESLKVGVAHAATQNTDGCMVLLGDQPLMTPDTIDRLIGAFIQEPHSWIVPSQEGMRGNPIIIPCAWYERVLSLQGDCGARQLFGEPRLNLRQVRIHEVGPFIDVDTPEAYQHLLKKYQ